MIKTSFTVLSCCLLLLINVGSRAQTQEISIAAGGGLAGFAYPVNNGATKLKPGFQAGIGYTKFINKRWGIGTGLEFGYYQTRATLTPNTVFSSYEVDSELNAFEFRVKTKGYEEKQKLYALNIPLMLQYQASLKGSLQFYSQAGVKFSIPLNSPYETKADEISAAGYYPDVNAEINDLPAHGFGMQTNWRRKGDYEFKASYALAAEAGLKIRVSARNFLYAGAYMDYGLNNIKKADGHETLLTYNPAALSESQATGVFSLAQTTGNVRLMAYGIKLRFGMGSKAKKVAAPLKDIPVAAPVPIETEEKPQVKEEAVVPVMEQEIIPELREDLLTAEEKQLLQTPIHFSRIGDTILSSAAKAEADKIAELMQRHDKIELQIEGHTCNLGSEVVNDRISLARGKAVAAYLQSKGIAVSRLHVIAKGTGEPLLPNTSETNRKQNRRVVFKVSDME